jgi:hypothetical protein
MDFDQKMGWATYNLGDFFTNSSGRPVAKVKVSANFFFGPSSFALLHIGFAKTQHTFSHSSGPQLFGQIQGCQIFLGTMYQHGQKYTKCPLNISKWT